MIYIYIINCDQLFDQLINFIGLKMFQITKYVRPVYLTSVKKPPKKLLSYLLSTHFFTETRLHLKLLLGFSAEPITTLVNGN